MSDEVDEVRERATKAGRAMARFLELDQLSRERALTERESLELERLIYRGEGKRLPHRHNIEAARLGLKRGPH